ncbi:MAG: hypothetical protein CMJ19_11225 [Phycisphaeraceae bacterium]|nr:hypothetical protein [Phycisphaeraceae bacterium]
MVTSFFRMVLLTGLLVSPALADLKSYVQKPDSSYQYQVVKEEAMGQSDVRIVKFTSQTWEDIAWEHWMYLVSPHTIQHEGKAVLVIVGGSNRPGIPKLPKEALIITQACEQLGVPVAILGQVPNQPLYGKLKEDNLIAHTMTMYFESGNEEQILLLPMVKSAVKAMDCVSALMKESTGKPIDKFVVTGASKRGWTTYLTAAVDQRVMAAAPIVIDMLKLPEQMEKQKQVYGEQLSPKITPYTSRGVLQHLNSERGKALVKLIDPYEYRHLLTMPKLLLLGTNDPFWTVDAANVYYDDLPGEKYISYVPNAGHGLNLTIIPTLLNFMKSAVTHTPLANFAWTRNVDGSTTVKCVDRPMLLELISSNNPTMDFREAKWETKVMPMNADSIDIKPSEPEQGYLAYYVKATYASAQNVPYSLSTQITVLGGQ